MGDFEGAYGWRNQKNKNIWQHGCCQQFKEEFIMGMIVQHNMSSMNANRNLGITSGQLSKSTEKLSSGYKINRAGDDAAGLAISEKMRGQIRGLDQASANSQDGISLIQTAEGALTETHSILQRMRELAVQAASDTNTDDDRNQIQNEIDQLTQEVDRIAVTTEFNTKKLLDGSRTGAVNAKSGSTTVEGTFANSNVTATIDKNNVSLAGFTDVIRIEITKDLTGTSLSGGSTSETNFKITDLFGKSITDNFIVSEGGNILILGVSNFGTTNTGLTDTNATTIKIDNVNLLKAGDVITITVGEMTSTKSAATGEDALRLQVGANAGQEVSLGINSMKAKDLDIVQTKAGKVGKALDLTSQATASLAVNAYDMAIQKVSTERAKMGAMQNRLEHTISNLDTSAENLQAAESRIRDTDMAKEMTQYSKSNILMQAGQSMLAQANQSTQGVLSLLQ